MIDINELRRRLSYDAETGLLRWLDPVSRAVKAGTIAGNHTKCYVHVKINGTLYGAHRLAWAIHHGEWPKMLVDHIDGDPHNNRISNLRLATKSQNNWNSSKRKDNKTGFKGVSIRENGRFRAKIAAHGKVYSLGVYETPEEAHEIYELAAHLLHGEFARPGAKLTHGYRLSVK